MASTSTILIETLNDKSKQKELHDEKEKPTNLNINDDYDHCDDLSQFTEHDSDLNDQLKVENAKLKKQLLDIMDAQMIRFNQLKIEIEQHQKKYAAEFMQRKLVEQLVRDSKKIADLAIKEKEELQQKLESELKRNAANSLRNEHPAAGINPLVVRVQHPIQDDQAQKAAGDQRDFLVQQQALKLEQDKQTALRLVQEGNSIAYQITHKGIGNPNDAINKYNQALSILNNNGDVYCSLAEGLNTLGRYSGAMLAAVKASSFGVSSTNINKIKQQYSMGQSHIKYYKSKQKGTIKCQIENDISGIKQMFLNSKLPYLP